MTVHVCTGGPGVHIRAVARCPTCDRRRRIVGWFQEWYGTRWTCCTCGESWQDGEIAERPFRRGRRDHAATRASAHWAIGRRWTPTMYAALTTAPEDQP